MMNDLKGKCVLITGASTGIGASAARAFGAAGAKVAVHYNASRDQAEQVAADVRKAGGSAVLIGGELSKRGVAEEIVNKAAAELGALHVLINNAGSMIRRANVEAADDDLLQQLFDLNVRSLVAASRAAIPLMRKAGGGSIINTTSIAARNGGAAGATLYAATKGFVSTFTRGLAKEVVKDKIRVNAVAPGVIATPFHERYTSKEVMAMLAATIPMGVGKPEECDGAYLYLASAQMSGYVTGQVIEVNGGQLMP
jgi:3-oxoacyl-[acyl-carrier protein] reductase